VQQPQQQAQPAGQQLSRDHVQGGGLLMLHEPCCAAHVDSLTLPVLWLLVRQLPHPQLVLLLLLLAAQSQH
jgi:hypothetical protein